MIKSFLNIFISFVFVITVTASPTLAQPEGGGDNLHANLESISLVEFIKFVGQYTGRSIVFNKGALPGTHVSIYAGQSLTEPELMAVFQQVLSGASFQAVTRDNVTYVLPMREAKLMTPEIKGVQTHSENEEIITSVFKLDGSMSPEKVQGLLQPLASRIGQVTAVPMADAVLIKDMQANIKKMHKLLNIIRKANSGQDTVLIQLQKSNAKTLVAKLNSFYKKLSVAGKTGLPPTVESIEWANSILVSGTSGQLITIKNLISKLDIVNDAYSKLKVYRLHNIEATIAGDVLKSLVTGGGLASNTSSTASSGGLSSGRTTKPSDSTTSVNNSDIQVSADDSTNTLIVMAPGDQLPQIDRFVDQLDQAQDQVYIEALVLETTLNNAKEFGVEWQGGIDLGGSVATLGYTKSSESALSSYASNPSSTPGGYSMGVLGDTISYAGKTFPTIAALVNFTKSASDFNLISAPQLMTLDNSEAEIFVGENRPYKTGESSTSGDSVVSTYSYKDVGIKLKITPHINREDGLIKLDVYQTYNTVSTTAGTLELPVTSDRKTSTKILLTDGSTMVIGGLIKSEQTQSSGGVPYLSDLPFLGWLFKSTSKSGTKQTLMVFLSARIIQTTEQLEALSKAKMTKYRKQRKRFSDFIDKEFNTYKNDSDQKSGNEMSSSQDDN